VGGGLQDTGRDKVKSPPHSSLSLQHVSILTEKNIRNLFVVNLNRYQLSEESFFFFGGTVV
jgi:hypothetical protein